MGVLKALRWQNNSCFTPERPKERNGKRWSKEEKIHVENTMRQNPQANKQKKRERNSKEAGTQTRKLLTCLEGAKNL